MSRKRKPLPVIEKLEITGIAAEGKSLGRWNDMVVFVPLGAPGDVVDVQLTKKRHSFAEGKIVRFHTMSAMRVEPMCEHYGVCGGCKFQHIPYDQQLKYKQQQVEDALQRIAKVELPAINPILGSAHTCYYRNKLEFTFSNKSWLTREQLESGEAFDDRNALGFHIPNAFDKVLDIKHCWLQSELSNEIRNFIRDYGKRQGYSFFDLRDNVGLLRTIMIRTASTGEVMLVVVFGEDNRAAIDDVMHAMHERFPMITSLLYVVNLKRNDSLNDQEFVLYAGREYIEEEMEGLRFRVGPKSFYQTNSAQAYELYKVARRMARLTGDELVYDLYTGTGTIANFVARQARQVIGIEYVSEAIDDARLNSQVNKIENTLFYAGDMKDILTDDFVQEHGCPDVMIIDPPRAGMHEDVVNVIMRAEPQRIVYVSCNPATQARDLAMLDAKYAVLEVQPVDMFPHTQHVENVVALERRF
ncbi:MAG: 23S rRNA (uracil(1939)-C(5))-methyltransferase RlmD [Muribaculaceae bacterium]|nr:23S rRNA (uracil(1939)-C(5))-methyltransferase RlmD [Muribaculaceae bacterium]MBQ4139233.1 23S rRNA (uracil(1939)-C(5))-methyltransferase RlmD [Muribaculaceae bacterium]